MADYNPILDAETDPEAGLRSSLFKRLAANPIAIAEGAVGAPRIEDAALDSTVTSAGATWVSERMAAQGHGEIGTLCFAAAVPTAAYPIGATLAGSNLTTASAGGVGGSTLAGTWRSLGHIAASSTGQNRVTLWQRVA